MTRAQRHRRWAEIQIRVMGITRDEVFSPTLSPALADFIQDSLGVELTIEDAIDLTA
jgi:hypothetical protein